MLNFVLATSDALWKNGLLNLVSIVWTDPCGEMQNPFEFIRSGWKATPHVPNEEISLGPILGALGSQLEKLKIQNLHKQRPKGPTELI